MDQRKKATVRNGIWVGVILVLIAIILISNGLITRMINARRLQNPRETVSEASDYKKLEESYQLCLTEVLEREGYPNSGITMTYVIDARGNREYSVRVHNRRLEQSGACRKQQILEAMSEVAFDGGICLFYLV